MTRFLWFVFRFPVLQIFVLVIFAFLAECYQNEKGPSQLQSSGEEKEANPKEPVFLVQPYLQMPTPDGMTVMWETNLKIPSRVEYGNSENLGQAAEINTPTSLHEIRLKGLQPGTTYYYRAQSGGLVSKIHSFKTAPVPGTPRWRMALYGDSRSNPAMHRQNVGQIVKANVDLILHAGDIVLNGKNHDRWKVDFFDPLGPLAHHVPWVSTIGNHENDSENYFSYVALPGNERYFGFD